MYKTKLDDFTFAQAIPVFPGFTMFSIRNAGYHSNGKDPSMSVESVSEPFLLRLTLDFAERFCQYLCCAWSCLTTRSSLNFIDLLNESL